MSVELSGSEDGPLVEIGRKSPRNGKATVGVEVVMTERERERLLTRIVEGETALDDRDQFIEAIGVGGDG